MFTLPIWSGKYQCVITPFIIYYINQITMEAQKPIYTPETLFWIIKSISALQEVYNEQCRLQSIPSSMTWNNIAEAEYALEEFIKWMPVIKSHS
jgi:ferric iron reductase protein FhuF